MSARARGQRGWTRRSIVRVVLFAAFMAIWTGPILYTGLFDAELPSWPRFLRHIYRVSCLFPNSVTSWNAWYIEARFEGQPGWQVLEESELSRLEPFGFHSRFDLILNTNNRRSRTAYVQRQAMAEWIARRISLIHPEAPRVAGIRYTWVPFVPSEELASQKGRWRKPLLTSIDPSRRRSSSEHVIP